MTMLDFSLTISAVSPQSLSFSFDKSKLTLMIDLTIALIQIEDHACAKALIVEGLTGRWGCYEERYNPDLADFPDFYLRSSVFIAKHEGRVVGVGILQPCDSTTAQIVRMSVSSDFRRAGVGSNILSSLLNAARRQGVKRIVLETSATWQSAIQFYTKQGFRPTHRHDGDQYFEFSLIGT